ncbi:YceI family protein [Methylobrevis pamukkalensis]|uniref:Lipid/polyisoprenoid-binding YceI-like domain-containing protein n=1 Tax=Methylobrevis pamukkalensis TaxID=1439726 RepID=A0A1E3H162_9HYPH|nr:YceI family protein [Methylobrevis pamukkalensis]ODN70059.1 hypothetical protein A6302_02599 [Methylobrevis pamukkalensis]
MALSNSRTGYGLVAQIFHWVTAILILMLLPLGLVMTDLPQSTDTEIADKVWLFSLHKTLGITVFAVAIARVLWALASPRPAPLHPDRRLETFVAEAVHWSLYGAILLTPLAGWVHHAASTGFAPIWWPLGQDLPFVPKSEALARLAGFAHYVLAMLMIVAVGLHIAGAMKHVVIDRDGTLARMLPFGRARTVSVPVGATAPHRGPAFAALALFALLFGGIAVSALRNEPAATTSLPQATAPVSASGWSVDHAKSRLGIVITQMGAPVEGRFKAWSAEIDFDPDALDAARVKVVVDIASIDLGGVTDQAKGADFLDAGAHPQAVFEAATFRRTGDTRFEVEGTLSLHGETRPVILPFDLVIDGPTATMTGRTTLNRIDFGVGAKGFADEGSVKFAVEVVTEVVATRAEGDG